MKSCHFPQLLQLSVAFFVKVYIAGVIRKSEPHGQVGNNVDMDQVLLAQSDSSEEVVVNGGQAVVNRRVLRQQDSVSQHVKDFHGCL